MAEYLINTMNRQDNSMANLLLMTGELPVTLIILILEADVD